MDPEECPLVRVVAPPRCEVLLLDVLPNSAPLVQSLEEEILRRTKGTMHFSQPEGNLWRAQISGAPDALQEVITFLTDTVGSEAVTVVGFRAAEFPEEDFEIYGAMDREMFIHAFNSIDDSMKFSEPSQKEKRSGARTSIPFGVGGDGAAKVKLRTTSVWTLVATSKQRCSKSTLCSFQVGWHKQFLTSFTCIIMPAERLGIMTWIRGLRLQMRLLGWSGQKPPWDLTSIKFHLQTYIIDCKICSEAHLLSSKVPKKI